MLVEVDFDDGTKRDFSADPRVLVAVPAQYSACAEVTNGFTLSIKSGATCSQVEVTVTVPQLAPTLQPFWLNT